MAGTVETLNETAVSWSEIEATVNVDGGGSFPDLDWKSIDHEDKLDRTFQRGQGGRIKRKTTGMVTPGASGSLYRSGLRELLRALVAIAPQNAEGEYQVSKVRFTLVIKHAYDGDPSIYLVELQNCSLDKKAFKHAEGADADTVDVDLNPTKIVEIIDGKRLVLL